MKLNGKKLIDLRDGKLLKQADAAAEIGVSIPTLSAAENGDDVRVSTAEKICEFYGVSVDELQIPRVKEGSDAA